MTDIATHVYASCTVEDPICLNYYKWCYISFFLTSITPNLKYFIVLDTISSCVVINSS
jgi:hypothetical protein